MMFDNRWMHICGIMLLLVWVSLVFSFSAQPSLQSNQLSKKIAEPVTKIITIVSPPLNAHAAAERLLMVNTVLRKCAHVTLYFILGALMGFFFHDGQGGLSVRRTVCLLFLCVALAELDEFHQLFVAGRTSQTSDVVIDSAGSIGGILLVKLFLRRSIKRG